MPTTSHEQATSTVKSPIPPHSVSFSARPDDTGKNSRDLTNSLAASLPPELCVMIFNYLEAFTIDSRNSGLWPMHTQESVDNIRTIRSVSSVWKTLSVRHFSRVLESSVFTLTTGGLSHLEAIAAHPDFSKSVGALTISDGHFWDCVEGRNLRQEAEAKEYLRVSFLMSIAAVEKDIRHVIHSLKNDEKLSDAILQILLRRSRAAVEQAQKYYVACRLTQMDQWKDRHDAKVLRVAFNSLTSLKHLRLVAAHEHATTTAQQDGMWGTPARFSRPGKEIFRLLTQSMQAEFKSPRALRSFCSPSYHENKQRTIDIIFGAMNCSGRKFESILCENRLSYLASEVKYQNLFQKLAKRQLFDNLTMFAWSHMCSLHRAGVQFSDILVTVLNAAPALKHLHFRGWFESIEPSTRLEQLESRVQVPPQLETLDLSCMGITLPSLEHLVRPSLRRLRLSNLRIASGIPGAEVGLTASQYNDFLVRAALASSQFEHLIIRHTGLVATIREDGTWVYEPLRYEDFDMAFLADQFRLMQWQLGYHYTVWRDGNWIPWTEWPCCWMKKGFGFGSTGNIWAQRRFGLTISEDVQRPYIFEPPESPEMLHEG